MVNHRVEAAIEPIEPETLEELSATVRGSEGKVVFNAGRGLHPFGLPTPYRRYWMRSFEQEMAAQGAPPPPGAKPTELESGDVDALAATTAISLDGYCGIVEHDADDQVVVVRSGTPLSELQGELAAVGQCLPFPDLDPMEGAVSAAFFDGPLIDDIGFNLPHGLHTQCGSWRDWVLGMRLVTPDGTVVKCGSKAVKNVAGYDVQKLMIGARGTLALIAEVTLRTFPLKALPKHELKFPSEGPARPANWIQRVLPMDFDAALAAAGERLTAYDFRSSTLWAHVPPNESVRRFEWDWVVRSGCGPGSLEFKDPTVLRLMRRTKELFDPGAKFNPGEMGVF